MLTRTVAGRVYDYSYCIGRANPSGTCFLQPVGVAIGEGDVVYVLNWGSEGLSGVPWNRTGFGVRVSKLTMGNVLGDEELVAEFSSYGDAPGQIILGGQE